MQLDYHRMEQTLAELLEKAEWATSTDTGTASELLKALGVPELLEAVALSEEIIRAADSFHPVARFFVDGTAEQTYIVDVLRRTT